MIRIIRFLSQDLLYYINDNNNRNKQIELISLELNMSKTIKRT